MASRVLENLETRGGFANELLQAIWESTSSRGLKAMHPSERALARELVYGVCRWRNLLDWALDQVSDRPVSGLDERLRTLLRMGAYQILRMERIPVWAAVNEMVDLAKATGRERASGFVNAVLRHLATRKDELASPVFEDPMEALVVGKSHPRWLIERWAGRFGREAASSMLDANNQRAPLAFRVNQLKASPPEVVAALAREGFAVEESPFVPGMLRLESGPMELTASEPFRLGAFTIQDEAAALVGYLASPAPGQKVLDACAAPGGKATHMAELAADRGLVVALDRHGRRIRRLVATCQRLGLESVVPVLGDAAAPPLSGSFDLVLLDAPCSGLGVLRRHPEGRWLKGPEIIERHSKLQETMLEALAPKVAGGGAMVYSVCSFEPEETSELIARWLERNPAWCVEDSKVLLPKAAHRWVAEDGAMLVLPEEGGPDGFYAVRIRREAKG